MSLLLNTFIYVSLYYISSISFNLNLINFFTVNDLLIIILWSLIIITLVNIKTSTNKQLSAILLYIFGSYNSLIRNFYGSVFLIWKNLTLLYSFILYNFSDFITFLPRAQIWTPLFKRGGYLFLLNSMRTRWQLSKSNSIFKNK